MKDREQGTTRVFAISEKTPNSWLVAQRSMNSTDVRWHIAGDIINNARELETRVDWGAVLDNVSWIEGGKVTHGRMALRDSISVRLATTAKNLRWDMHSPEVVYMGGFHLLISLTKRVDALNQRLAKAEERKFTSEENRELTLRHEQEEMGRLGIFRKRLQESLQEYAQQNLPDDLEYLQLLERVLYMKPVVRQKIFVLLRKGTIKDAASFL